MLSRIIKIVDFEGVLMSVREIYTLRVHLVHHDRMTNSIIFTSVKVAELVPMRFRA